MCSRQSNKTDVSWFRSSPNSFSNKVGRDVLFLAPALAPFLFDRPLLFEQSPCSFWYAVLAALSCFRKQFFFHLHQPRWVNASHCSTPDTSWENLHSSPLRHLLLWSINLHVRVLVASLSLLWSPSFAVVFPSGLESAALPVSVAVAVVVVEEEDDDDEEEVVLLSTDSVASCFASLASFAATTRAVGQHFRRCSRHLAIASGVFNLGGRRCIGT